MNITITWYKIINTALSENKNDMKNLKKNKRKTFLPYHNVIYFIKKNYKLILKADTYTMIYGVVLQNSHCQFYFAVIATYQDGRSQSDNLSVVRVICVDSYPINIKSRVVNSETYLLRIRNDFLGRS